MDRFIADFFEYDEVEKKIILTLTNVVLYDGDDNHGTTNDQIVIDGSLSLQVFIDFYLSLLKWKFHFWVKPVVEDRVEITATIAKESFEHELLLGVIEKQFVFLLSNGFPVIVTPSFRVSVGAAGDASINLAASVSANVSFKAGLKWDRDNKWQEISERDIDFYYEAWPFCRLSRRR